MRDLIQSLGESPRISETERALGRLATTQKSVLYTLAKRAYPMAAHPPPLRCQETSPGIEFDQGS